MKFPASLTVPPFSSLDSASSPLLLSSRRAIGASRRFRGRLHSNEGSAAIPTPTSNEPLGTLSSAELIHFQSKRSDRFVSIETSRKKRPSLPPCPMCHPFPSSSGVTADQMSEQSNCFDRTVSAESSVHLCQRANGSDPIEAVQSNRFEWNASIESPCPRRRCRASERPPRPGPPS